MSSASSVRSRRRRTRRAVLQVSASDAKNGFGRLLDRVAKEGRLAITKHDEPCAMLISIDEYRVLSAAHEATLETLAAESRRAVRAHAGARDRGCHAKGICDDARRAGRAAVKDRQTSKAPRRTRG